MSKVKVLSIVCIGLLAANLVLVWFLLSYKPPHARREQPKKVIIENLHLDEGQQQQYEILIEKHRTTIDQKHKAIVSLKNKLYTGLSNEATTNAADSLLAEIAQEQVSIEQTHYQHFQEIKNLCKPEQLNSFDELMMEITKLFSPGSPPPHAK